MRIIILDPGLRSATGEAARRAALLVGGLQKRGTPCCILGNSTLDPAAFPVGFPALPAFENHSDSRIDGPLDQRPLIEHLVGAENTTRDLTAAIPALEPDDLLLARSFNVAQLHGLNRWYEALPAPRPRLTILLDIGPDHNQLARHRPLAWALAAQGADLWSDDLLSTARLTATGQHFAQLFGSLIGRSVEPMPMLVETSRPPLAVRAASAQPRILYLGNASQLAGFDMLPDAFCRVLAVRPDIRPLVVADGGKTMGQLSAFHCLEAMASRVDLMRRTPSPADIAALVEQVDAVLLIADPESLASQPLALLGEVAAQGKIVLTRRGSWVDQERQAGGAVGVPVEQLSAAHIADAILSAANQLPELLQAAHDLRLHWTAAAEPEQFLDALIGPVARPSVERLPGECLPGECSDEGKVLAA